MGCTVRCCGYATFDCMHAPPPGLSCSGIPINNVDSSASKGGWAQFPSRGAMSFNMYGDESDPGARRWESRVMQPPWVGGQRALRCDLGALRCCELKLAQSWARCVAAVNCLSRISGPSRIHLHPHPLARPLPLPPQCQD